MIVTIVYHISYNRHRTFYCIYHVRMSILWTPWVYGPEQKSSPNPANNRINTSASTLFAKYLGSFFKVIWKITDVVKVRGKRSVMVGEVPLPWGTPLEIISVTKKHIGNNELKLTRQSYLLISLEIPNEAYMLHSQFLIGCSLLSEEWCKLIGWYWRIMRRQVNTLTCPYRITMIIYTLYAIIVNILGCFVTYQLEFNLTTLLWILNEQMIL